MSWNRVAVTQNAATPSPEEIAAQALYLCSDEASFVTGSSYPIDGGAVNLR